MVGLFDQIPDGSFDSIFALLFFFPLVALTWLVTYLPVFIVYVCYLIPNVHSKWFIDTKHENNLQGQHIKYHKHKM